MRVQDLLEQLSGKPSEVSPKLPAPRLDLVPAAPAGPDPADELNRADGLGAAPVRSAAASAA